MMQPSMQAAETSDNAVGTMEWWINDNGAAAAIIKSNAINAPTDFDDMEAFVRAFTGSKPPHSLDRQQRRFRFTESTLLKGSVPPHMCFIQQQDN